MSAVIMITFVVEYKILINLINSLHSRPSTQSWEPSTGGDGDEQYLMHIDTQYD